MLGIVEDKPDSSFVLKMPSYNIEFTKLRNTLVGDYNSPATVAKITYFTSSNVYFLIYFKLLFSDPL